MRRPLTLLVIATTAVLSAVAVVFTAAPAGAVIVPQRVITVESSSAAATTALLTTWTATGRGGYVRTYGPVKAYVGELGIGQAHEGIARTPAGVFTLTQAFGNQPDNGSALPYFRAGRADWWDGESGTPAYNTHVHQTASPGAASENLYDAGYVYSHAVVIDYNRFPVHAGAGSAFFLHVTNGQPTAGCVAIDAHSLDVAMRWLAPSSHPVISIGVGSAATAIITKANAAAATHNPVGHVDKVAGGHHAIGLAGWAADPDASGHPLNVDVYIDGRMRGRFTTGVSRPDVAAAKHYGPNQGFAITVSGVVGGVHRVCAYALNIYTGAGNPVLPSCATVRSS